MATLGDLGGRYQFNTRFLGRLTEDFSGPDWGLRDDEFNAAHWVLAHITGARRGAMRLMGHDVEREEWETATGLGGERGGFVQAPTVADLLVEFESLGAKISESLAAMGPDALAKEIDADLPDGSKTVNEGVFGLYMHECIHLGQFTMMRRLLGKPRFM
jgi:hypothetical protein